MNVLITGASRGIGKAVAITLAKAGYDVGLLARDAEKLEQVAQVCQQFGVKVKIITADMSNEADIDHALNSFIETFGGLDNLVVNHGVFQKRSVLEDKDHEWRRLININLTGLMYLTHQAVPHILQSKAQKRSIIFTASISSKLSGAGGAAYSASKHGVLGFANSLFEDIREHQVKVSSIMPGFVKTDMTTGSSRLHDDRMIQPEDIADTIKFVMESATTMCPTEIIVRPQRTPYKK